MASETRGRLRLRAALWVIGLGAGQHAIAQQTPPAPAPASTGAQVFEADFFRAFNPVNAGDMVSRVPGFEINDGDDRRGFGATAGNVLINGQRPSSKANISEQLRRIPASSVLRIELLSGSTSGVDVRGQSQLVNVVMRATSETGSPLTYVFGVRHLQYSNRLGYTLQLSKSFRLWDDAELSLDLQTPNIRGRGDIFETRRNAAGALTLIENQYNQPNFNGVQGSANFKWKPTATDSINLNGLYYVTDNSIGIGIVQYDGAARLTSSTYGRTDNPTFHRGELGGDWERKLGEDLSFKLIGLATFSENDSDQFLSTFGSTGRLVRTRRQLQGALSRETVGRGTLTWNATDAHTLEFGAEAAFNTRDSYLNVDTVPCSLTDLSTCSRDATKVEELRGEAFITDIWRLNDKLTLESGFTFEASRITQSGSDTNEREFTYPKPSIAATWTPAAGNTWRASLERDIAQLDFSEFALTLNPLDDTALAGNPDLEPEKAWKARLEWDRRFGRRTALTLGLFHDEVEDVRDLIVRDIDPSPTGVLLVDAVGNIDKGTRTGIELRGNFPLDGIGLKRADFRFNTTIQETKLTDPFTGQERSFSSGDNANQGSRSGGSSGGPPPLSVGNRDWGYVASVRQELPSLKSSWSVSVARNAERQEYRKLETIVLDRPVNRIDLNWETTAIQGLTVRFGWGNILAPKEERTRTFFTPTRSSNVISSTRFRTQGGGPEGTRTYSIQVAGKF
jgi:hypothetical protein